MLGKGASAALLMISRCRVAVDTARRVSCLGDIRASLVRSLAFEYRALCATTKLPRMAIGPRVVEACAPELASSRVFDIRPQANPQKAHRPDPARTSRDIVTLSPVASVLSFVSRAGFRHRPATHSSSVSSRESRGNGIVCMANRLLDPHGVSASADSDRHTGPRMLHAIWTAVAVRPFSTASQS